MGEPSRGQDVLIDIFLEGDVVETLQGQSYTYNQVHTKTRQERCGSRYEQPRIKYHGWEGEVEFEEEDPVLEDLIDAAESGYYEGKRIVRIDITGTTYYPKTGEVRTYVYPEAVFSVNRNVGGKNEESKSTLSWAAAKRERVGGDN
tara:strand:+ start:147 stop:584 length:438 start_codon:yes stop_codon:yes gene_type:complete